jgi:hypothetical protein
MADGPGQHGQFCPHLSFLDRRRAIFGGRFEGAWRFTRAFSLKEGGRLFSRPADTQVAGNSQPLLFAFVSPDQGPDDTHADRLSS